MELRIKNKRVRFFNNVELNFDFDSVANSFGLQFYFNPDNEVHRELTEIGSYYPVELYEGAELLISGTIVSQSFVSSAKRELVTLEGYSKSGLLMDCNIPPSSYPLQTDGLSLLNIAKKLTEPFGIEVVNRIGKVITHPISESNADATQSISSYISDLAKQRDIVLSSTPEGNIAFDLANVNAEPSYIYTPKSSFAIESMALTFGGQSSNSEITVMKEASDEPDSEPGQSTVNNPLLKNTYRPSVKIQTSGDEFETEKAARLALASQLKQLTLSVSISSWKLNDTLLQPNRIIQITNPELHLYKKTNFFIESVKLSASESSKTAQLKCVLPEVYGGKRQNV